MNVVVLPNNPNATNFRAINGNNTSVGETIGQALDSLSKHISLEKNSIIYIQDFEPDEFFAAEQQQRMSELMTKWRELRDANLALSTDEQKELEQLVELELIGSAKRTAKIADKLGK
jgi:hypothetical protein